MPSERSPRTGARRTSEREPTERRSESPLKQSIAARTRTCARLYMRLLEARITPYGITSGMWFFLRALWEEDGISQAELAERAGVMGPTTANAMERMERMGLIERRTSPSDRRRVDVFLTAKGKALEAKLVPIAAELLEASTEGLSKTDVATLKRLLDTIIGNLQRYGTD